MKRHSKFDTGISASAASHAPISMRSGESAHSPAATEKIDPVSDTNFPQTIQLLAWILDEIDLAIGIINADGTLIYGNRKLKLVIEAQNGLSLSRDRLAAPEIQKLLSTEQKSAIQDGRAFRIQRPSGAKAYLCFVRPIPVSPREAKKYALFISDAEKSKAISPQRIIELFDVTNQEARIASLLAAGVRLDEASAQMGISIGTGRFHLKNLLGKTATSRQAELSQLINCLFDKVD